MTIDGPNEQQNGHNTTEKKVEANYKQDDQMN